MALVTVQRSPGVRNSPQNQDDTGSTATDVDEDDSSRSNKSLSECYFANKGAALVLPAAGRRATLRPAPPAAAAATAAAAPPDIHHHLQSMFYLLRPEETLNMAVKLESAHPGRTRYLAVVCRGEEAALLGVDCARRRTTVGLVLRVLADTSIKLDGDGGFSVCVCGMQHIFKPVSVQAMWSALQSLHRASARARDHNHFAGGAGASHAWTAHYEQHVASDRSCLNEWHAMDCIESRRPPSPDSLRTKPREREETERVIRSTLKEIMMSVDLDEVTSKFIRGRLEADLNMDLGEFKSFIDQEMLTILGQMDAPTEIFDHVYLGSEWNASNLEELQRNGVRHILNVTREIDNFFPGMFDYLNIRVYDDEKTDLLKHWDNTFKYITKAKKEGSKVLVHCKMGVSRSASMVIAYAMKAYDWNFEKALKHVKEKRNCIKPNTSFLTQLETYQGILDAMKNREKLQRSKSETNLKSTEMASKIESKVGSVVLQVLTGTYGGRPRSWSPDTRLAATLLPERPPPTSLSLETLAPVSAPSAPQAHTKQARHMLMPCANGSYSVSPNQIMNLNLKEEEVPSVKTIIHELESAVAGDKKNAYKRNIRLSFSNCADSRTGSDSILSNNRLEEIGSESIIGRTEQRLSVDKTLTWDPGEVRLLKSYECNDTQVKNEIFKCDSGVLELNSKNKPNDSFSHSTDRIFDKEEKHYEDAAPPSRQSSWSSFDSAVVPDLSRHSSWGSYDTHSLKAQHHCEDLALAAVAAKRTRQKLEEASAKRASAELVDLPHKAQLSDLDIISENRTFQPSISRIAKNNDYVRGDKVKDNERKFNETCAIIKRLEFNSEDVCVGTSSASWPRLSTSAPGDSCLRLALGARRLRPASSSLRDLSFARRVDSAPTSSGLVRNLKKEFEARSDEASASSSDAERKASLTSSPTEDLSVKVLVDKYDSNSCKNRIKCTNEHVDAKVNNGRSYVEDSITLNKTISNCDNRTWALRSRPPAVGGALTVGRGAPVGAGASTTGRRQLQHGKTHPLSRLSLRGSNPVYNTM